jgi:hypothetical protein
MRAGRDYSEGGTGTQEEIAKNAGKMGIFLRCCENRR